MIGTIAKVGELPKRLLHSTIPSSHYHSTHTIATGYEHTVSGLPIDVVLTKDDTSAVVTVTIMDNNQPADDTNVTIYGIPNVGAYGRYRFQELSHSVTFTVLDNDRESTHTVEMIFL